MKGPSCKQRIASYLWANKGQWFNGGEIERLAISAGYKASNGDRRMRELAEESKNFRDYSIEGRWDVTGKSKEWRAIAK